MDWYLSRKGERRGPFDDPQFRKLLESGEIKPDDLVWHRGLTEWRRAESLTGLSSPPPIPGDGLQDVASAEREAVLQIAEKDSNEEHSAVESPPGYEPTQAILSSPPKKSYFVRHWRGELSLGVSYWINWSLLSSVFIGGSAILLKLIDPTTNPTTYCFAVIGFWALDLTLLIWLAVGLWRSSVNHIKKYHRFFWARSAQVIVCIGVMTSLYNLFFTALPQVKEYAKIGFHSDPYSKYEIRILRQGTEIEVSGAIAFGLTEEVKKHLDANPNIRVIHLNSIGGRIVEGRKLRDLIASRQLTTYSSQQCFSACTDAFIGGKVRVLHNDAKLGFHQPSFPGLSHDQLNSEIESEKQFFLSAGVDRSFVEKALSTPKDDMWEPSTYELLQARVITKVSDGSDFGMSGADTRADSKQIESWLLEIPLYQKLKEYCPETYEQILKDFINSIKTGDSKSELVAKLRIRIQSIIQKSLPYAADDALFEYVKVMISEIQQLGNESGDLCYMVLFPSTSSSINYTSHLPKELLEAELNAYGKLIQTASTTPQPVPSDAQVSTQLKYIMTKLVQQYGNDVTVLADSNSPTVDKSKLCEVSVALFKEVLKLPKNDCGNLLRWMFAGGFSEEGTDTSKYSQPTTKPHIEEQATTAQPTNSSGNSRNEIMENTLRSYYLYIEQKDIDSAIGCFTAAKQRSIKRNVLTTIAKDTEHFYIDKMNILANRGNTSKILIALYHKKYGNPLELWEVTAELAEEGGEWKIADIQGRKIK